MINITKLNKAEVLMALYNFAKDAVEAKILINDTLEMAVSKLNISLKEVIDGKTNKTSNESEDIKKIIKVIKDTNPNNYLTIEKAQLELDKNKFISKIGKVYINIDFSQDNINVKEYNKLYGFNSAETIINNLKDFVSLDFFGKIKKKKDTKTVSTKGESL